MRSARRLLGAGQLTLEGAAAARAVAVTLATLYVLSTIPTPLYEPYRAAFHFSRVTLTLIYAAYVVGSLGAMLFFGHLSDQIGRRPVVLAAVAAAAVSTAAFLLARSTAWLFVARVVSGVAIALASGAATAWIVELRADDKPAATRLAIGANMLGLGLGPLLAGVLAAHAPAPLRTPWLVFLGLLLGVVPLVLLGAETVPGRTRFADASLRPRLGLPRSVRFEFIGAAVAAFATFAVLGFYAALTPSLMAESLHLHARDAAGAVVGGLFLAGTAAIATIRIAPRAGMITGLALLVPGIAALEAAQYYGSLALLLAATLVGGVATGLGYRCGLEVVNGIAPEDERSQLVSTYLVVCYAAISLPVIGVGLLSRAMGSMTADAIFGGVAALLAIAALVFELRRALEP
jgi:MFS family permease